MFLNFKTKEELIASCLKTCVLNLMVSCREFNNQSEYMEFMLSQADSVDNMSNDDLCNVYDMLLVKPANEEIH